MRFDTRKWKLLCKTPLPKFLRSVNRLMTSWLPPKAIQTHLLQPLLLHLLPFLSPLISICQRRRPRQAKLTLHSPSTMVNNALVVHPECADIFLEKGWKKLFSQKWNFHGEVGLKLDMKLILIKWFGFVQQHPFYFLPLSPKDPNFFIFVWNQMKKYSLVISGGLMSLYNSKVWLLYSCSSQLLL